MPKPSDWTVLVEEAIKETLDAAEAYVKEFIKPIADVGNPEKVMGKPYEEWTEQDKMTAGEIYGPDSEVLNRFIFNKEYKVLKELEG